MEVRNPEMRRRRRVIEVQRGLDTIVNTYRCSTLVVGAVPEITLACTIKLSAGQAISKTK